MLSDSSHILLLSLLFREAEVVLLCVRFCDVLISGIHTVHMRCVR